MQAFIKQRRGQNRQGQTTANEYGTGKTQEQSSEQTRSIGGERNPVSKTKRDNPGTR